MQTGVCRSKYLRGGSSSHSSSRISRLTTPIPLRGLRGAELQLPGLFTCPGPLRQPRPAATLHEDKNLWHLGQPRPIFRKWQPQQPRSLRKQQYLLCLP